MQTHLFHDRIMRMDTVVLEDGATLGTHCVALPAAKLGAGATVGPASLVMRGDEVPASTPLAGQSDCAVDGFRKKRAGSCRPKPRTLPRERTQEDHPSRRSSTRTCPSNGNFGYRVSRYELDLEYKVAINRLAGSATITAVTLAALRTFSLDLSDALTVSKVTVNGRRPAALQQHRTASCTSRWPRRCRPVPR